MTHQTNFKPRPRLLDRRKVKAGIAKTDQEENEKVRVRSGGACEVKMVVTYRKHTTHVSCALRAFHIHHLISGIGRRNRGVSILAEHKLHVCAICHQEIHGHVLTPINAMERESAATVRYERVH